MANRRGKSGKWQIWFSWAPKSLQTVTAAMKLKDAPLKKSYDKPRQHIKKLRHHFADKGLYSQSESESPSVMSNSLRPHGLHSSRNSPGQNTGVGSLSLLQGIFPTQGSNPGLPHSRQILYQLSHKGSPRILEWVAYPFSNRSSWPKNRTGVSCIAGRFFTSWATREASVYTIYNTY